MKRIICAATQLIHFIGQNMSSFVPPFMLQGKEQHNLLAFSCSPRSVPHNHGEWVWLSGEPWLSHLWRDTPRFPEVPLCKWGKLTRALGAWWQKSSRHMSRVAGDYKQLRLPMPSCHRANGSVTVKQQSIIIFCHATDFPLRCNKGCNIYLLTDVTYFYGSIWDDVRQCLFSHWEAILFGVL